MDIIFEDIKYSNIMSVGAKPVDLQLNKCPKTLLTGFNGAGKSTFLEALCFLLYGKPFRNITKGQLINSINKKKLLVEGNIKVGKNRFYIKRGIKPNILEIHKNGVEIPEMASVKDFQEFFEQELLGISLESFKQIIVLGTAGYLPFMELPAAKRRGLVEDLLDVSVLGEMDKLNKSAIKQAKEGMTLIEQKLESNSNEQGTVERSIDSQKAQTESFIAQETTTLKGLVVDIKASKASIVELEAKKDNVVYPSPESYEKTINDIECSYDDASFQRRLDAITEPTDADLSQLLDEVEPPMPEDEVAEKLSDLKVKVMGLEMSKPSTKKYEEPTFDLELDIDSYDDKINAINETRMKIVFRHKDVADKIAFFEKGGDCPTCGQGVGEHSIDGGVDALREELAELDKQIKTHEAQKAKQVTAKAKHAKEWKEQKEYHDGIIAQMRSDEIHKEFALSEWKSNVENANNALAQFKNTVDNDKQLHIREVAGIKQKHETNVLTAQNETAKINIERMQATTNKDAELRKAKSDYEKRVSDCNDSVANIKSTIESLQFHIDTETKQCHTLKAKIEELRKTEYDTSELDKLKKLSKKLRAEKTKLFEQLHARGIMTSMLKDNGIKAHIVRKYIPVFNKKINEYLNKLGADYIFTLDESFNESIKSRGREDFTYTSFSQGERARINVALLFTWRDVASIVSGVNISLLILDEVFDNSFDASGVSAVNKILTEMTGNSFVISHRPGAYDDSFQRHLKMVKRGRYSTLEDIS